MTFWEVWFGRRWRHELWFRQARQLVGDRPAILVVDLLPGREIITQVEGHRQQVPGLDAVQADRIFVISAESLGITGAELSPDMMTAFETKLQRTIQDMWRSGAGVIHYFHSGPFPTIAMVGAALANGPMVQTYHWRQGKYESWGPLRHAGDV